MIDTEALFKAKQNLQQFLTEHPELQEKQAQIEAVLNKCNNSHNRLAVIQSMMMESVRELSKALNKLKDAT
jgi:predicted nuclease with TOPRIM domain